MYFAFLQGASLWKIPLEWPEVYIRQKKNSIFRSIQSSSGMKSLLVFSSRSHKSNRCWPVKKKADGVVVGWGGGGGRGGVAFQQLNKSINLCPLSVWHNPSQMCFYSLTRCSFSKPSRDSVLSQHAVYRCSCYICFQSSPVGCCSREMASRWLTKFVCCSIEGSEDLPRWYIIGGVFSSHTNIRFAVLSLCLTCEIHLSAANPLSGKMERIPPTRHVQPIYFHYYTTDGCLGH